MSRAYAAPRRAQTGAAVAILAAVVLILLGIFVCIGLPLILAGTLIIPALGVTGWGAFGVGVASVVLWNLALAVLQKLAS